MWVKHQNGLREDLVLIPMPKFGGQAVTGMGSWSWGISSQCDHPDAAWKVMEFLLEPTQIARNTTINGAVPSRYSVIKQSSLYRMIVSSLISLINKDIPCSNERRYSF
jgi:multiple sugar transport system substrate-binding protein